MSGEPDRTPAIDHLHDGLQQFYSSQAAVLLSQYENINQLLGPTSHWTHPGTHCEVLLRDFLRRHLVKWMSVDKGYIYGRTRQPDGTESHSPEIDILIHNEKDYSPVFRLDDFVIVDPRAVVGMIQVKRTFSKVGKESPLEKGLCTAVAAKQHLLDLLVLHRPPGHQRAVQDDLFIPVFSGVVAFDQADDVSLEEAIVGRYWSHLEEGRYPPPGLHHNVSQWVLPTFVGSLKGECAYSVGREYPLRQYYTYAAEHGGRNISLQLLLHNFLEVLSEGAHPLPKPFAFPALTELRSFYVPPASEPLPPGSMPGPSPERPSQADAAGRS